MGKVRRLAGLLTAALLGPGAPTGAALGPYAAACAPGSDRPAMLVRIVGLKARSGAVRVQAYGGDPAHYFDKGTYLKRIDVAVPAAGPVEVCMPLARPGIYAISVRHDVDGSGNTGLADGGGMSGNPRLSLWSVLTRRKPDPVAVEVRVAGGVVPLSIVMNYVQGGSFRPVATAAR